MANKEIVKQKENEVKELTAKMKDAKLVLLTNYRGINVADDTALRKASLLSGTGTLKAFPRASFQSMEFISIRKNMVY